MTNAPTTPAVKRRGFFAAIAASSTAVVTAAVSLAPKPAEAMTPPGTKGGAHYTESAHVKQFYAVNRY